MSLEGGKRIVIAFSANLKIQGRIYLILKDKEAVIPYGASLQNSSR
ncbi:hypothetical protein KZZ20_02455 [Methylacidiphilum fumariolicum]|uniref:Uncharacterized protein n=1 Tax=Candidatus Methylacidiphilum fumarolicum TaxID=591154 RepID=A0ABN8XEX3_9BACT|nr:hypothetical protein [Candidatus Methylacidiphilum fumarolicum]MBW6414389.1 hypothetical protein [Candidatus Methylacidiphilum fumarolicum]CAI9085507.1 conserved protein of unknown function [Candidatus Methylacidiphilum fumarolicum]